MHQQLVDAALSRIDLEKNSYAFISDDKIYRYWLHRSWFSGKGWLVFLMLNPSTADQFHNDPTIRRCIGFAQMWGYRGVIVVNVFAGRATDPNTLYGLADPVGPRNELFIRAACRMSPYVVCAWGAHDMAKGRRQTTIKIIREMRSQPMCLGLTKNGSPQHPLFVRADRELVEFNG